MKTAKTISLIAVLATAAIMPAFHDAFAMKADTSDRLSPKSYGEKTTNAQCGDANCFEKITMTTSDHPSKTYKQTWSEQRTQAFMAQYLQTLGITAP